MSQAYFICAALRMVLPAVFLLIVCPPSPLHVKELLTRREYRSPQASLVAYPASRKILFPPVAPPPGVPPSATDPLNQKGDESLIAGVNHPIEHRSRAEQIEEQAWEFTNLIQRFGARVVVGGKAGGRQGNAEVGRKLHVDEPDDDDDDDDLDDEEQDLHEVAQQDGLGAAADKERREKKLSDKKKRKQKAKEAKIKRDAMIGNAAKMTQDILGTIADLAEVFAKCVSRRGPRVENLERLTVTELSSPIAAPSRPRSRTLRTMPAKPWRLRSSSRLRSSLRSYRLVTGPCSRASALALPSLVSRSSSRASRSCRRRCPTGRRGSTFGSALRRLLIKPEYYGVGLRVC